MVNFPDGERQPVKRNDITERFKPAIQPLPRFVGSRVGVNQEPALMYKQNVPQRRNMDVAGEFLVLVEMRR